MPSVSSSISRGFQGLNGSLRTVVPSQGTPSRNSPSSDLSTWSVIKIYPDGVPRNGRGVTGGRTTSGNVKTWVLPLPIDLTESNSFTWEQTDFGAFQQFIAGGPLSDSGELTGTIGSVISGALNAFGAEGLEQVRGAFMRSAANPATEILFKSANLRTFQFSWNLIPLTSGDSTSIVDFRKEMINYIYPEAGGLGGATRLKYPAEFELSFYARGKGQQGQQYEIFKTFPCACTEFTLTYGVQGSYGVHEDGKPTQVSISATFQEIYMLVQKDWN